MRSKRSSRTGANQEPTRHSTWVSPRAAALSRATPGCRFGDVDADDARAAALEGDGEGEGAAPRAQVQHGGRTVCHGQELERLFDQELGFRTRHQHRGGDLEGQGPELANAGEIGDGHALRAAGDELAVGVLGVGGKSLLAPHARARRASYREASPAGSRRRAAGSRLHATSTPTATRNASAIVAALSVTVLTGIIRPDWRALRPDVPDSRRRPAPRCCRSSRRRACTASN